MSTPFLESLQPVDLRTPHAKVAQRYMQIKGFRNVRPIGVTENGAGSWYYYYEISDGLLELEVDHDPTSDSFSRTVTALITDPEQIRDRLGP